MEKFSLTKGMDSLPFVKAFIKTCEDGWLQGWHERNGGNLTYRLTQEDKTLATPFLTKKSEWIPLGVTVENLAEEWFLSTGSGKFFRNVSLEPEKSLCLAQVN
ncbi:MAG: rhamnulose-1-phosphate aldolase, partial [Clostridiales bacterium]|nr:rhamnulose-1-phosphate aldolase [Clostridiales bacterium]